MQVIYENKKWKYILNDLELKMRILLYIRQRNYSTCLVQRSIEMHNGESHTERQHTVLHQHKIGQTQLHCYLAPAR